MVEENSVTYTFERDSGVATLRFNRPNVLNAINVQMARTLSNAVAAAEAEPTLRCLVLAGEGRAFMAGGDVSDFLSAGDNVAEVIDQLLDALNPTVLRLRQLACPVLALAQGAVAGAGLSLLAACDLAIAGDNSQFLMAYDKIGALPDCGGSALLPLLLGERRANELMFSGAVWTAPQALEYGLVNRVCAVESLAEEGAAWAAQLAAGPTRAYAGFKALRNARLGSDLAAQLERERAAFVAMTATADFREGIGAFVERRKAQFSGQ